MEDVICFNVLYEKLSDEYISLFYETLFNKYNKRKMMKMLIEQWMINNYKTNKTNNNSFLITTISNLNLDQEKEKHKNRNTKTESQFSTSSAPVSIKINHTKNLPNDVLGHIIGYVPNQPEGYLVSLRQINKHFHQTLTLLPADIQMSSKSIERFVNNHGYYNLHCQVGRFNQFSNLRTIKLSRDSCIKKSLFSYDKYPNLQCLILDEVASKKRSHEYEY
eukprot:245818_1